MRSMLRYCACLLSAALVGGATAGSALATSPINVVFGTSWDGPSNTLQAILDAQYGAGNINVTNDYIGRHAGDPDPFYWTGIGFHNFLIREVAGNANNNAIGWYKETGSMPVIDGVDDGVVFNGPASAGATFTLNFPGGTAQPFGFYMNPNGPAGAINAPEPELFFTNRKFNDLGPDGSGAIHEPFDGDVQAIVFDVSPWTAPNTWVVCFEDLDSGADPAPCCSPTDNDFNDLIFEVTVFDPVPVQATTWSSVKVLYR